MFFHAGSGSGPPRSALNLRISLNPKKDISQIGHKEPECGETVEAKNRVDARRETGEEALARQFFRLACGIKRIPLRHPISPLSRLTSHQVTGRGAVLYPLPSSVYPLPRGRDGFTDPSGRDRVSSRKSVRMTDAPNRPIRSMVNHPVPVRFFQYTVTSVQTISSARFPHEHVVNARSN